MNKECCFFHGLEFWSLDLFEFEFILKTTTRETEGQDAPSDGQSSSSDAGKAHGEETEGPKGEVQPADQLLESPDRSAADEYGKTEEAEEEDEKDVSPDASRVALLKDVITKFTFLSCNRGLFDKHKLTVAVFLTLRIMASC